jgi:hypothetical protein
MLVLAHSALLAEILATGARGQLLDVRFQVEDYRLLRNPSAVVDVYPPAPLEFTEVALERFDEVVPPHAVTVGEPLQGTADPRTAAAFRVVAHVPTSP